MFFPFFIVTLFYSPPALKMKHTLKQSLQILLHTLKRSNGSQIMFHTNFSLSDFYKINVTE